MTSTSSFNNLHKSLYSLKGVYNLKNVIKPKDVTDLSDLEESAKNYSRNQTTKLSDQFTTDLISIFIT